MFKLLHFLKDYKKHIFWGQSFKLFEAILELTIPTLMAFVIDNGVKHGNVSYTLKIGGLMLLIAVIGMLSAFTCQYFASIASQGSGTLVRNALFSHIGTFSHVEIDNFGTASLINRITNDVNQLQFAVAMWIRLVIRAPFLCIGGLIMAMLLDLRLSIVILLIMPLFVIVLFLVMSKSLPLYNTVQRKLDSLAIVLRENLSGIRVIRAFTRVEYEKSRFENSNKALADTAIAVGKISSLMNPATSIIMNFAIIAIIWFGGIRVNLGHMTQGQIIAYINYVTLIFSSLIVVANLVVTFTKAAASAARVNEVFETEGSIKDVPLASKEFYYPDAADTPIIEFRKVSFKYKLSNEYALKDISFKLNAYTTVGIIGATGSGKSTLVNLIPRFYDCTEGSILVNGIDVKAYAQKILRNKIGLVPQKAVLFTGTIAENLSLGVKEAPLEDLESAADIAQASGFIKKLPEGYNSPITQGGLNFSGGQKQRLTIARALVKKPEILILDDSSSALDYTTDAALRKSLRENTKHISAIIVSQRVTSVKDADLILVMEDGELVGMGSHKELIKTCEIYKEICLSQLDKEEVEELEK